MIWCNGRLSEAGHVRIAPDDRGFALGDGVFETVRVIRDRLMHLDRHLARLRDGATLLGIPVAYDDGVLADAAAAVRTAGGVGEGALRITLSRGPAPRGLATPRLVTPTVLMSAWSGRSPSNAVKLVTARCTRRNEYSPLSRIKSLSYLDNILARREAEAVGADDALMLNTAGRLADSTVANILVLVDNRLWTPPVSDGALPGIARARLMANGLVSECEIGPDRLSGTEALFLCNSLGIRPVSSLDGLVLTGRPDLLRMLAATLLA